MIHILLYLVYLLQVVFPLCKVFPWLLHRFDRERSATFRLKALSELKSSLMVGTLSGGTRLGPTSFSRQDLAVDFLEISPSQSEKLLSD
jgi:hypothetical protein